jgi:hypothetical protein
MKTKHESLEMGIDTGCEQYQLNDSVTLNFIGNSKVGPCLILKVNGQKKGLYIEKNDAYELMSIVEQEIKPLAKIIEWFKGKHEESWDKLSEFIELNIIENKRDIANELNDRFMDNYDYICPTEYDLNNSLALIIKDDRKLGPSLFLKIEGHKVLGIFIEKDDAYELMSIVEEDTQALAKLIEWSKGKGGSSWNKFINKIEAYLADFSQHEKNLSVQIQS